MNTQGKVNKRLFSKTDLATHKVELGLVDDIEKIVGQFDMALAEANRIDTNMGALWGRINAVQDDYDMLKSNYQDSNGAKNELGYLMQQFDKMKNTYKQAAKELGIDSSPAIIKNGDAEYKKAEKLFKALEISRTAAKKFI